MLITDYKWKAIEFFIFQSNKMKAKHLTVKSDLSEWGSPTHWLCRNSIWKSGIKIRKGKGLEVLWLPSRIHSVVFFYNLQYTGPDSLLNLHTVGAEDTNYHWKWSVYTAGILVCCLKHNLGLPQGWSNLEQFLKTQT